MWSAWMRKENECSCDARQPVAGRASIGASAVQLMAGIHTYSKTLPNGPNTKRQSALRSSRIAAAPWWIILGMSRTRARVSNQSLHLSTRFTSGVAKSDHALHYIMYQ